MKRVFVSLLSVFVFVAFFPAPSPAAETCPPEVAQAKALLSKQARGQETQAPRSLAGARGQESQAPRGQEMQAPRGQESQAPRGQEKQAPRGQEMQAPRGQESQAPRGQEMQAPRGQETQAPRSLAGAKSPSSVSAAKLIAEAESACKAGDSATAAKKLEALKLQK